MPLSNYAKDTFVAPEMSTFTSATIPDLSNSRHDADGLISNFVLNSMFTVQLPAKTRQVMFNFLRRCQIAHEEYDLARIATETYLSGKRHSGPYMKALHHWEACLGSAYHALLLPSYLGQTPGQGLFSKGDGSIEEQLNLVYNSIKHTEKCINSGSIPQEGTLPVWLTNTGLQSTTTLLSYSDLSTVISSLMSVAIKVQEPATFLDKRNNATT